MTATLERNRDDAMAQIQAAWVNRSSSVTSICRELGIPRSSFYAWAKNQTAADRQLPAITRLTNRLNAAGHDCSVDLIAKLVRESGLRN